MKVRIRIPVRIVILVVLLYLLIQNSGCLFKAYLGSEPVPFAGNPNTSQAEIINRCQGDARCENQGAFF